MASSLGAIAIAVCHLDVSAILARTCEPEIRAGGQSPDRARGWPRTAQREFTGS